MRSVPKRRVDVERVKFEAASATLGPLRGDYDTAAPGKWIEHDVAALGDIQNSIAQHFDGLACRMDR